MLPVSLTGDYARDYYFYFSLFYNPINLTKIGIKNAEALSILGAFESAMSLPVLMYISSFARRITPPTDIINTEVLDLGGVQIDIPKSYSLQRFTVSYIDDELNSVYNFHLGWQNRVRNGWSFQLLYLCSLSCAYGPGKLHPPATEIEPTSVTTHPSIFPVEIKQSDFNREGNNLREVSVTYIRLPVILGENKIVAKAKETIQKYLRF